MRHYDIHIVDHSIDHIVDDNHDDVINLQISDTYGHFKCDGGIRFPFTTS